MNLVFGFDEDAEAKSTTTLKQVLSMVQVRQCARDIAMKGLVDGPVKWAGFPEDSSDPESPSEAALATRGGFMVQATSTIEASARPLRTATGRRLMHAVWMPPVLAADVEEELLPAVVTPQVIIKTKIRLEPPFEGEEGIRLWTTPTDHTAKGDRKMHLHYADSALSLLRASRQCAAEALSLIHI